MKLKIYESCACPRTRRFNCIVRYVKCYVTSVCSKQLSQNLLYNSGDGRYSYLKKSQDPTVMR